MMMGTSDPQGTTQGSHSSPTPLTTVSGTTPSHGDSDIHKSLPLMKPSVDDGKPSTLRGSDGVDYTSPTSGPVASETTSPPIDTDFYSSLPLAKFLIGDEVTCDEEDKMWYTEEETENLIPISVPAEANSIRADVKKLAVHQMLVLFHLHTEHYGDRCSGPGIQYWMLSMLDRNLRQAYRDAFAHIRHEREPDPKYQHGAFLNLWIRRTIEKRLQGAANKAIVEVIKAKTREGCIVDLESYEKMLSVWGVHNDSQAV